MKRFAVLGSGIQYTLSPIIHQANFKEKNIDAIYEIADFGQLEIAIPILQKLSGFNVTIPYKEEIINYCDFLSDEVKAIKASNTIKIDDEGQFHAFNTDVYGFYQLLKKYQLNDLSNKQVLIIGAGGASKAIYYVLKKCNADITITNRTLSKANKICKKTYTINEANSNLDQFDLVINATNVGVKNYSSPIKIKNIKDGAVFIDLNYQHKLKFLDDSYKLGAKTINGMDMLIYQAAKSYEIWFDDTANLRSIEEAIRKENEDVNR